ncbi:MAG TPA: glyoxalase [Natronosporangium sp.]
MTTIEFVTIEVDDVEAADRFYTAAFGLGERVRVRASHAPTTGFRGFTMSLVVSQPGNVDALFGAAVEAGAKPVKPAAKSLWGYGGVLQAPDGTIWTIASQSKKDKEPASRKVDQVVLQLGVADVAVSKQFYLARGLTLTRSFGKRYVEFAPPESPIGLTLYRRRNLAKVAGVAPEGSGSRRLAIGSDAGPFADPDGYLWEAAEVAEARGGR